jgi:serine/threonine protein kinase/Tol biopolymer transport system component
VTPERYRRIKDIFQTAAERPLAERAAYVAAAAADDSELQREVDHLLRHATGTGVLDRPAWSGGGLDGPLDIGCRIGPYEILEEAGAGGMGRVYKARDTRLGRTVAIKVLSAEFSHRLRIEGRAISALNHPHVCALYDIGDQDGAAYLVMEYVDGESLAARIARGPLPVDAVLGYGSEIASALAAAHAQGIVHRDLKPANVMITASGAKVLDFGVARMALEEDTAPGGLVGTVAYMSPSQFNGNPADARSDVYALGLVLYEMATGSRYATEAALPPDLPAALAALIERCLRVDSARRVQRMEEVQTELERMRRELSEASGRRTGRRKAARRVVPALALAVALLIVARNTVWVPRSQTPGPTPTMARLPLPSPSPTVPTAASRTGDMARTSLASVAAAESPAKTTEAVRAEKPAPEIPAEPPPPPSLGVLASYQGTMRDPAFSPGGVWVAFAWHKGSLHGYGIFVRPVMGGASPIPLTEGDAEDWGPAWSPDGARIAFRRKAGNIGIYLVDASGAAERFISTVAHQSDETLPQLAWTRDGKWIIGPDRDSDGVGQLFAFGVGSSAANGDRRQLTWNSSGVTHAPAVSPDGKALAYAWCPKGVASCDVYVTRLSGGRPPAPPIRVTSESSYIRGIAWMPDGASLIYSSGAHPSADGTYLWRLPVNPPGLAQRIDLAGSHARHPAVSSAGLLAYTKLGEWNLMMIRNYR